MSTVYSCVIDTKPVFAYQALLLVHTLVRFGDVVPGQMVVHYVEGCDPLALAALSDTGVSLQQIARFSEHHAHSNKLQQMLTPRLREAAYCVLLDCDMAAAGSITSLPAGNKIRAKIVDHNPLGDLWLELYRRAGFGEPQITEIASYSSTPTPRNYCNGGLYVIPKRLFADLAAAWPKWADWTIGQRDLLGANSFYTDQIAFSLGVEELRQEIDLLPAEFNCPTHLGPQGVTISREPNLLHYHQQLDEEGLLIPTGHPLVDGAIKKVNDFIEAERRTLFTNHIVSSYQRPLEESAVKPARRSLLKRLLRGADE